MKEEKKKRKKNTNLKLKRIKRTNKYPLSH